MSADTRTDSQRGSSAGIVSDLELPELQALVDPPTGSAVRLRVPAWLTRFHHRLFSTFTRAMSGRPLATWARRVVVPHVVPHVLGSPWVRRSAFAFVSELGIRYRRSPAVIEGEPRQSRGPRPGDRLPDAGVLVNGRSTYLQQVLAGPHLALLLCGDPRDWDALELDRLTERYGRVLKTYCLSAVGTEGSWVDEKGHAFARLGVRDTAQYLERPDGYIAFRSAGQTLESLDRYLSDWYVPAS